MKFKTDIVVDKPIKDVFKYLVEPKNLTRWVNDLKQYNSKTGKRTKTGGVGTLVFEDSEGLFKVKEEVTQYQSPHLFELKLSNKDLASTVINRLLDQGESTKIIVETEIKLKPWMANLFAPFMRREMRLKQEADYKKLKELLEGN